MCGICPRIWLVPLKLNEQELKVKTVPSEQRSTVIPPSPLQVRAP